jgi:hypothetical protein
MTKEDIQKIIVGLLVGATIVGGIIIGLPEKTELMTYDEYQLLLKIYNYEIQQSGGKVDLQNVTKENFILKLNDQLSKREIKATTTVDNMPMSIDDYKVLKSGLFKKAERNKTIAEKIIENIIP